jgi:hypothetical protein
LKLNNHLLFTFYSSIQMNSPFSCYFLDLRISFPGLRSRMFWGKGKYILLRFTKYSLQQTNNKWNSSPIDCPHKVQNLSSLGILYHRPISISKYIAHVFMKLHLCTSQVTCMRVNKILGLRNTQPRLKIFETNLNIHYNKQITSGTHHQLIVHTKYKTSHL